MSLKKPRSDAKLLTLPEEQQAKLADWLLGGMPYHAAREAVAKEFGVEVRSLGAFSAFYSEVCSPLLLRRRSQAVAMAEEIAAEATRSPARFDQATVDAIKQKAFELAISPMSSPKDVKALFALLQKSRDQELKERDLGLKQEALEVKTCEAFLRWHKDQRVREIAEGKGTNAEKIAALRQAMFADVEAAAK
jgi:hypothetical protein